MFQQLSSRTNNRFLMWVLFVIGLTFMPIWSEGALARVRACRADPIVVLSDRRVVRMMVEIEALPADVDTIVYTLHVPKGVTAEQITYTGGELGRKEHVKIVDDLANVNTYTTQTLVTKSAQLKTGGKSQLKVKATSQVGGETQTLWGVSGRSIVMAFDVSR